MKRTYLRDVSIPFTLFMFTFFLNSCMSFRSDLEGGSAVGSAVAGGRSPVSVLFHFTHLEQERGLDVVPKIVPPRRGFRDIFGESMKQLSNIGSFATYTDSDNDIDNVERRRMRDSLQRANDVTVHFTYTRENSFSKHVLASIISYGTASLVPMGYSWDYLVTATVTNNAGTVRTTYQRSATVTTWYQLLFLFVYPFYPSEVKIEEIYLESTRSILAQIEQDGVLHR
ncbi:MAG: hypothetical protein HUU02_15210 [Bacteroidetes bacterium]|nr:hypothetical protein [Bacteroidota bacterium]